MATTMERLPGVKMDFAFDLLTGSIKSISKEFVIEVRRGDLVLRDMGYFSLNKFTEIEQRQA